MALLVLAVCGLLVVVAAPAAAHDPPGRGVIVLEGAGSAEGIAPGYGSTFFAGELATGDVYRGELHDRSAHVFIDAPDGRNAVGMDTHLRHGLLFVAGGPFAEPPGSVGPGRAYVYDLRTGATVAALAFGDPSTGSFINDVVVTRDGAWFTDSVQPRLFFVPIGRHGRLGEVREVRLDPGLLTGTFPNLNGITATEDGRTLIVAHSTNQALYTVDPRTGATARIQTRPLPFVDGIELDDRRLYAVQNMSNQVSVIRLDRDLDSGRVKDVITDARFQVPTTAILTEKGLAVVNAQFELDPAEAGPFEVVLVRD